jgi:hypothetical protein
MALLASFDVLFVGSTLIGSHTYSPLNSRQVRMRKNAMCVRRFRQQWVKLTYSPRLRDRVLIAQMTHSFARAR